MQKPMSLVKGYLPRNANAWVYNGHTLSSTPSQMVPQTLLMPKFSTCNRSCATSVVHNKIGSRRESLYACNVVSTVPIGSSLHRRVEILQCRAMLPSCLISAQVRHACTFRSSAGLPHSPHDATQCILPSFCILHVTAQLSSAHASS